MSTCSLNVKTVKAAKYAFTVSLNIVVRNAMVHKYANITKIRYTVKNAQILLK